MTETAANLWPEKKVIVAVSGGIACYKIAALVSKLVQAKAQVRVIMTKSATRFVTPLTFQALSGHAVLTSIWQHDDHPDSQHIGLARWADLLLVAPCTANTLSKLAHGLCNDLVSLTAAALPKGVPVLLAPAMNAQMWENPITQQNLSTAKATLGYHVVGPETGWQACRTQGTGRMSEPEAILQAAHQLL